MKILKKILFCSLFFIIYTSAFGFEPLNTDDAGTIAKGTNQVEQYFYAINQIKQPSGPNQRSVSPGEEFIGLGSSKGFPITYSYGLSNPLEISVGTQYYATPRGNYSPISGNSLSLKWRYFGEDYQYWNLAIKPMIQLPNSNEQQIIGLGQAKVNYGTNMIASYYSQNTVDFHFNIKYLRSPYNINYLSAGSAVPLRTNLYTVSTASVVTLTSKVKAALDLGVQTNPQSTSSSTVVYGMLAAILSLSEEVDIGVSLLRSALNMGLVITGNGQNSTRLDFGVTWRFN